MYSIAVTMMWTAEKRAELHNYRQLPDAQNISDKRMGKRERERLFFWQMILLHAHMTFVHCSALHILYHMQYAIEHTVAMPWWRRMMPVGHEWNKTVVVVPNTPAVSQSRLQNVQQYYDGYSGAVCRNRMHAFDASHAAMRGSGWQWSDKLDF